MSVELLLVMEKKEGRSYQRIPLTGALYKTYLPSLPPAVASVIRKLADEALLECLVKGGFAWLRDADKPWDSLDERHYIVLRHWMSDALQELKPLTPAIPLLYYLPAGQPFMSTNIRPASISTATPALRWVLERKGGYLSLRCFVEINSGVFPLEEFQRPPYFLKSGNEYFLLKKDDSAVLDELAAGAMEVREEGLPRFLTEVVRPLAERYPVDMDAVIRKETIDVAPSGRVYVSELNENFLLIKPKLAVCGARAGGWRRGGDAYRGGRKDHYHTAKKDIEQELMGVLRGLHMKFEGQTNGYFYLNFKEALEKSWFLRFYQQMQQMDIPVLGMNKLRKFKYNTSVPQFEIITGRSIDWFDLTIRVSYGDLVVPLNELRKAILGRQDYILLSDGSLGILPKEWIDKYSLLLRMGHMREGGMRLPAVHWAILQESGGADEELQRELSEKKRRLLEVDRDRRWPVPAAVNAQLRDYQVGGFQWMCLLDDMGWGGCLADDMGLGKTLQTLSFLQHLVETYPDETHLVVCPTSLLYNWEGS
ncbi:SNF2-related protein [Puia sp. P3]|uniref:SNF2-related protein n=1 Tax=Puia sp. P3 TaxID=3423952 RepID=UPI003D667569